MSKPNSVEIFEPENMLSRIENLGYTFLTYTNEVLDKAISSTTLERMAKSGYASDNAVEKVLDKSPVYGSYILFGTPLDTWHGAESMNGKPIPKDVRFTLMGMATYIKTTSMTRKISKKRLMKELKGLLKEHD